MNDNINFWQRVAKFYSIFMKSSTKTYNKLGEFINPYLEKNMKVLEIGCGTGQLSYLIADTVNELIATDFSDKMIKVCKENNTKGIIFQVEDGTDLSFKDSTFDAVVMANVLHIVPDPDSIVNEIKRVLKSDGIIIAPIFITEDKSFNIKTWILEKIGFKIREHTLRRVPYMLVCGDKEIAEGKVAVRTRKGKDLGSIEVDKFVEMLEKGKVTQ